MLPIIVATLAPILNCIQLLPQLHKTFITKRVHNLSFWSILLIVTTNILWLLHGIFIYDYSLIIAGIITLIINVSLLGLFLAYSKKKRPPK
jgi:uncharacterized protein with PQ loop repeat